MKKQPQGSDRQLLAEVDHALRSPLSGILNRTELILLGMEGEINDQIRGDVQAIEAETHRLYSTIQSIIHLVEADTAELALVSFDMVPVVKDVLRELQSEADQLGRKLSPMLPDNGIWITADLGLIRQVVRSLLLLQLHLAEQDSVGLVLEIGTTLMTVCISDGDSPTPSNLAEVIELPQRYLHGSFGIEWLVNRRLVTEHQGEVWVSPSSQQGISLNFALPITANHPA